MRSKFFVRSSLSLTVFRLTTDSFAAATCSIRFGGPKDRKRERTNRMCVLYAACVFVARCGCVVVRTACVRSWTYALMLCVRRYRNVAKNRKSDKTFAWQVAWKIDDMVPYRGDNNNDNKDGDDNDKVNAKYCYSHWCCFSFSGSHDWHTYSQLPLVVMSHRHPRAISTIQTYHAKYVRISSQRSALCLLLTVLSAWVSSHRLRVHNDFSTWIKTIRARIYTKATECRITLPMRFTHIFFRFFCLFVCFFLSWFFLAPFRLRQNVISHLYASFPNC